ncbi:hypothetical protein RND81_10G128800 [Saponaria officinalis]|uniref:BZIP domain-containing protein n=1 Tax=Saponaria officinalis TaxID=3572 RepID=A0AAW1I1E4_SAPOF
MNLHHLMQQNIHTCYHAHTRVISSKEDGNLSPLKPKIALRNREAVKKYREKKKAHTAFLEAEVKKLRVMNEYLVRRVEVQAALEAEISSLRDLLVCIREMVDVQLGCLPFQTGCKGIDLQFPVQNPCFARNLSTVGVEVSSRVCTAGGVDKPVFSCRENCEPAVVECHATGNETVGELDRPSEAVEKVDTGKK